MRRGARIRGELSIVNSQFCLQDDNGRDIFSPLARLAGYCFDLIFSQENFHVGPAVRGV